MQVYKQISLLVLGFCALVALSFLGSGASKNPRKNIEMSNKKEIYFAGGCFWGTEHFFSLVRGVVETEVGYANSIIENPSYQQVCTGETQSAETVRVVYDSEVISLDLLLDLFFQTINPTTINQQGNDVGTQYRTGIYYTDDSLQPRIQKALNTLQSKYNKPIVVECLPLKNFYPAEDYHQDYLDKNPGGYCHIGLDKFRIARMANPEPKPLEFKRKDINTLRKELTPIQYAVTQQNATEHPFDNDYWNEKREGIYVDITTGEPLFISTDKFDSGCGWPSFSKPIDNNLLKELTDKSHGMVRTEVRSKTGDAHLGHVFNDGPKELGGLRYCINSASLRFIPKEEMKKAGYATYLPLLEKKNQKAETTKK